jgi:NNP family nitrate/nitrite transporter-like MFS transporter
MAFLYIGTFGSFIGYSSAMPLLIKLNFWNQPVPTVPGIGINFVYYAFLGALVGSAARPLGGWLADRFGGAKVTLVGFAAMILGTLAVLATLFQLSAVPKPPAGAPAPDPATFRYSDAVRAAVDHNSAVFPLFLAAFLFVFAATGIANGSTYRMIPAIWKGLYAARTGAAGSPERVTAERRAAKESSAVLGLVGAVGALGGFLIPITFGAPWVSDPVGATKSAFMVFAGFYVVCLAVTWVVYLRKGSALSKVHV